MDVFPVLLINICGQRKNRPGCRPQAMGQKSDAPGIPRCAVARNGPLLPEVKKIFFVDRELFGKKKLCT